MEKRTREQVLEDFGIHDKPRCGHSYEVFSPRQGLVTLTCHKPLGHEDDLHVGGTDGGAASWGSDAIESSCVIAYRCGLRDGEARLHGMLGEVADRVRENP